jgi:hypothetical protein
MSLWQCIQRLEDAIFVQIKDGTAQELETEKAENLRHNDKEYHTARRSGVG